MLMHKKWGSRVKVFGICLALLLTPFVATKAYAGGYAQHQISIKGFEFVPKELQVSRGDTVVWVNHDIVPHSIVISSTAQAISPELESGETFIYVVGSSMAYQCGLHPSMTGKLTIP